MTLWRVSRLRAGSAQVAHDQDHYAGNDRGDSRVAPPAWAEGPCARRLYLPRLLEQNDEWAAQRGYTAERLSRPAVMSGISKNQVSAIRSGLHSYINFGPG